jgi:hypothetical protein
MKKSVYYLGMACAVLMMFGSLFKIQHWPGASVMLVLAVMLFCFFFLPMALVNSYNEGGKKYKTLHVVTFIVFFVSMMGVIFKVQHWPGAGAILPFGITLPFVLFLPVYLYQTRNNKDKSTLNFSGIMFGLTFLAVFSALLSLSISKYFFIFIGNNIEMNEKVAGLNPLLTHASTDDPVAKNSDDLFTYIETLKKSLLVETGNTPSKKMHYTYDAKEMVSLENSNIPSHLLMGEEKPGKMEELKSKISAYRESLVNSQKISPELKELANTLLDVSDKDEQPWEYRTFSGFQLIAVLDALTQIQSNIRLLESEVLAQK